MPSPSPDGARSQPPRYPHVKAARLKKKRLQARHAIDMLSAGYLGLYVSVWKDNFDAEKRPAHGTDHASPLPVPDPNYDPDSGPNSDPWLAA